MRRGILPNMAIRSESSRGSTSTVRRQPGRVSFPQDLPKVRANLRRVLRSLGNPSLANLAQLYLDSRYPSEGPRGLIYTVQDIPPSHTPESVVKVLDAAVAVLGSEMSVPTSPAVWDGPNDLIALFAPSLTSSTPQLAPQDTSNSLIPLVGVPAFPQPHQSGSPEAVPVFHGHLIDVPELAAVPARKQSSMSIDDLLLTPHPGQATLLAPLIPATTDKEFEPGPDHLSLVPDSKFPPFRKERRQSQTQVKRMAGTRDLKSRAATVPNLPMAGSQLTPTCLQIGGPTTGPGMAQKSLNQDSLKICNPSGVNIDDLPRPLQARHSSVPAKPKKRLVQDSLKVRNARALQKEDIPWPLQTRANKSSDLGPGPDLEMDNLIHAIDVVKDSFKFQLDPLEPNLGDFSCDFSSVISGGSPRSHWEDIQSKKSSKEQSHTSTSATSTTLLATSSRSSIKLNDVSRKVGTGRRSSAMDGSSRPAYSQRPLPQLPLAPERKLPARQRTPANLGLSNATVKALIAAGVASNISTRGHEERLAKPRLSKHSAAVVNGFSEFAHRTFFDTPHSVPQQVRSQSDGTLWPQAPSQNRRVDPFREKPRAVTVDSIRIRKEKGKGIVFVDDGLYTVSNTMFSTFEYQLMISLGTVSESGTFQIEFRYLEIVLRGQSWAFKIEFRSFALFMFDMVGQSGAFELEFRSLGFCSRTVGEPGTFQMLISGSWLFLRTKKVSVQQVACFRCSGSYVSPFCPHRRSDLTTL
jgi:hypothetical protein